MIHTNRIIRMDFGEPKGLSISRNTLSCAAHYLLEGKNEYSPLKGEGYLLEKINSFINEYYSINTNKEEVLVTNGGLFGIQLVVEYLRNKGISKIYIPNPGFPPYQHLNVDQLNIIPYQSTSSDIMFKEINRINNSEDGIVIIITSPNNPNGVMLNPVSFNKIDLSKKNNFFILDNSFHNYSYKYQPRIIHDDNVFNVFSFSKSHALAAYRIGFILNKNVNHINDLAKIQWNKTLSVSGISQMMAYGALDSKNDLIENNEKVKSQIKYAEKFLNSKGIVTNNPDGGFFLWLNTNDIDTRQLSEIAYEKYGISIMEGRHFGSEGVNYIRINCALDKESLEEGLKRLVDAFNYFYER
ncbi:TPA: pyridoxal phosphate-dependent aminotransferase [Staphylococcus aureus]|nr:pyridoxal phosphate-dependent aminotransferase [Staphylococcus aureus]